MGISRIVRGSGQVVYRARVYEQGTEIDLGTYPTKAEADKVLYQYYWFIGETLLELAVKPGFFQRLFTRFRYNK